jgi:hypothetical protein
MESESQLIISASYPWTACCFACGKPSLPLSHEITLERVSLREAQLATTATLPKVTHSYIQPLAGHVSLLLCSCVAFYLFLQRLRLLYAVQAVYQINNVTCYCYSASRLHRAVWHSICFSFIKKVNLLLLSASPAEGRYGTESVFHSGIYRAQVCYECWLIF